MEVKQCRILLSILVASFVPATLSVGVDMGDCVCMCDSNDGSNYITPVTGGKFLQSIKGPRGDMGLNGVIGQEGPLGPRGIVGRRGPPGKPVQTPGSQSLEILSSCKELRASGTSTSGIYRIKPGRMRSKINVYCDMEIDGGGWTLVASVHENNIYGKCTSGDNWSSDEGLGSNYTGPRNWESAITFGQVDGATSADYKSPAYIHMLGSNVMLWHVPNDVPVSRWNERSFLQYYTQNNFLKTYGGNLRVLFSKYFPLEKQADKGEFSNGLFAMTNAINETSSNFTNNISGFFRYAYDQTGDTQTQINDGGSDMFDTGNKVYYKVGEESYKQIVYGKAYSDLTSGIQVLTVKTHPFTMLMWIDNAGGAVESFGIRVQSGTGADSSGRSRSYKGTITTSDLTCHYDSYNVYDAGDPSICEVYFFCASERNWNSTAPDHLTRSTWSSATDNLDNAVSIAGNPQNVLMGYTLLSRQSAAIVTEDQVQSVLRRMANIFARFGPVPAIDCSRNNESLSVPVRYAKGSDDEVLARVPPTQKGRVKPGYIHFRAVDPNGNPNAVCPGVKSSACFQQSVCVGGIPPSSNSTRDIRNTCGDFSGWAGRSVDIPAQSEPSGSARSLDDINSSILMFVR